MDGEILSGPFAAAKTGALKSTLGAMIAHKMRRDYCCFGGLHLAIAKTREPTERSSHCRNTIDEGLSER
jgi:hypothetical protein